MNYSEFEILFTVCEFVSLITVPSRVKAEDFDIYLHRFKRVSFLFWKLSPTTDKNDTLQPKLV